MRKENFELCKHYNMEVFSAQKVREECLWQILRPKSFSREDFHEVMLIATHDKI